MTISPGNDRRETAYATLRGGAHFLIAAAARSNPTAANPQAGARYYANCLRELDRFLHVLMDETALVPLPMQRNAANKIGVLAGGRIDVLADQWRLRALGRTRACLWHCHGVVRRADAPRGDVMTAGWLQPQTGALQRYRLGERLVPTGTELADVGRFYDRLAGRLDGIARAR